MLKDCIFVQVHIPVTLLSAKLLSPAGADLTKSNVAGDVSGRGCSWQGASHH